MDLWQADLNGRYSHPADPNPAPRDPNFQGWGQAVTGAGGAYSFRTFKPAAYPLAFLTLHADVFRGREVGNAGPAAVQVLPGDQPRLSTTARPQRSLGAP